MEGSWKTVPDLNRRNRSGRFVAQESKGRQEKQNEKKRSSTTDTRASLSLIVYFALSKTAPVLVNLKLVSIFKKVSNEK